MKKIDRFLGHGLYTVREAALYARVSPQKLSRWLFGTTKRKPVIDPQFKSDEKLVSFLDLVQALAIKEIRFQRPEVTLEMIRDAIILCRNRLKVEHPFAIEHFTFLFGEKLVIRKNRDEYIQVENQNTGQILFPFVETYLSDLTFDEYGVANKWRVRINLSDDKHVPIVLDPKRRFGEPLLPSGHTVSSIFEAVRIEGGVERAAKVYGIPKEEAEASYKFFFERLGKTVA